jgi:hypothetical protein
MPWGSSSDRIDAAADVLLGIPWSDSRRLMSEPGAHDEQPRTC